MARTLNLRGYQRRHNVLSILKGIGWLTVAVVTWYVSYWVIWCLVAVLCYQFGSIWNWTPSAGLLRSAAWIGIALLAFEGIRFGKKLLERETYAKTAYYDVQQVLGGSPVGIMLGRRGMNPMAYIYLISEFLLFAPRATMRAFFAFITYVSLRDDVIEHAEAIIRDLQRSREWTSPLVYAEHKQALYPLHKLGIIWEDVKDGELRIKLHPNFADRIRKAAGGDR